MGICVLCTWPYANKKCLPLCSIHVKNQDNGHDCQVGEHVSISRPLYCSNSYFSLIICVPHIQPIMYMSMSISNSLLTCVYLLVSFWIDEMMNIFKRKIAIERSRAVSNLVTSKVFFPNLTRVVLTCSVKRLFALKFCFNWTLNLSSYSIVDCFHYLIISTELLIPYSFIYFHITRRYVYLFLFFL